MNELENRIVNSIKEEEIVEMAKDLINIASPPGHEGAVGDYLAGRLTELGMAVRLQGVEAGRNNVIGRLPGSGKGPTLLFSGHFDTSTTGQEHGVWSGNAGGFGGGRPEARVKGGWVYGLGAANMKGAIAAYFGAVNALKRADIKLAGDILIAGVVGETERAPVDQYQGIDFRGGKVGSKYLVTHGLTADYAIIGEPTGLRLQLGETGYCFAKITVHGKSQHTWCKEFGIDPIDKMTKVIAAIKDWEPIYKERHRHSYMEPRIGIGAIQGGYPYKPCNCPAPNCNLYIDIRTLPGENFLQTRRELEAVLEKLKNEDPDFRADVDFYLTGNGYELEQSNPVVKAVTQAHFAIHAKPVSVAAPNRHAVSSDGGPMFEYGIKALCYGPGGVSTGGDFTLYDPDQGQEEVLSIQNLVNAARVYALAALDICRGS
jgi:acetylornithine deacetylase